MANKVAVIVVGAGSGSRAASQNGLPKQYQLLADKSVIANTIAAFAAHPAVDFIQPVINLDFLPLFNEQVEKVPALLSPIAGGDTRQQSVRLGLLALLDKAPNIVLIHDAARPFVSRELIQATIDEALAHGGALPVLPVTDTLKHSKDGKLVSNTIDRSAHFVAQTPQAFDFARILEAHNLAANQSDQDFTDDSAIAEWANIPVRLVQGDPNNKKITFAKDLEDARARMNDNKKLETRVGTGFDVHAFEPGDHVILGGIKIPHDKKLKGHSDADVALHTITDAIYGALARGDIGQHFPPSDEAWKGKDSAHFLEHACALAHTMGGRIINIDLTIICEQPKIGPHCNAMRQNIAKICGLNVERVSVKATTTERLGFTGRSEGIAAQAAVALELPSCS